MTEYQYLVAPNGNRPFLTHWFDSEMFPEAGGWVYDLLNEKMSKDGICWEDLDKDHL